MWRIVGLLFEGVNASLRISVGRISIATETDLNDKLHSLNVGSQKEVEKLDAETRRTRSFAEKICDRFFWGSTTENRGWLYLSHADAQKGVPTAHGGSVGTAFWLSAY